MNGPMDEEKLCNTVSDQLSALKDHNAMGLNIAFFGNNGSGKSSLINGIITAVTQKGYKDIARSGMTHDSTGITKALMKLDRCGIDQRKDFISNNKWDGLPNLIDISGFPNEDGPGFRELLHAVLFGRVENEGSLREGLIAAGKGRGGEVLKLFPPEYFDENKKVHRIVFVASAESGIPEGAMKLAYQSSIPDGVADGNIREVPIFLAITHMDKVDKESSPYIKKKAAMVKHLGLHGKEDLTCFEITNYSSVTTPERKKKNYPEVDTEILKLLEAVSDTSIPVVNDKYVPDKSKASEWWCTIS